ncbi:MAG: hypothetical protein ACE10C_06745, partial [Candidatus Binatia bacterium]
TAGYAEYVRLVWEDGGRDAPSYPRKEAPSKPGCMGLVKPIAKQLSALKTGFPSNNSLVGLDLVGPGGVPPFPFILQQESEPGEATGKNIWITILSNHPSLYRARNVERTVWSWAGHFDSSRRQNPQWVRRQPSNWPRST